MSIVNRTAVEHIKSLSSGEYSSRELVLASLKQAEGMKSLNLFLKLDREGILRQAEASDDRRKKGKAGPLEGIPVAVKDNISIEGETLGCASRILENFVSPYTATVIRRLREAGAILFGRTNMDEFAMGSSTENSAFGVTGNPWAPDRVPGGSSGGSAAAVASLAVPLSIGSDTGGSIRQPAAMCGIVGVKPTYGRVSRYGLVAFASSLDQIGPFSRSVEDSALLLSIMNGTDRFDSTSHPLADERPVSATVERITDREWKKLRIGVQIPDKNEAGFDPDIIEASHRAEKWLRDRGATIVPVRSSFEKYVIPIYYILATAEASSNLMRYDGVRYGKRADNPHDLKDLYIRSRTEGFGNEVKRRILLGTYVLSSGYYDAYYKSAQKARRLIQNEYSELFKTVDVILQPTSPTTAFRIGEKQSDPVSMYQSDILTISANLGGVPAISIPVGFDNQGLPIGLQLVSNHFDEERLFRIASALESLSDMRSSYDRFVADKRGG
jgi:aspartyl-tRNA(Asn)/glutamyl-tRNA(Gln) amidotransferase subunit A